ncbi:MAG TPA: ChaN family lipoprotein [Rubrivivax sp.]|nr:ChaN family lipoprotein [Rubrivivax sp.]HPO20038.1 ChaN family lipoprotein [Rubrivivax sp.]
MKTNSRIAAALLSLCVGCADAADLLIFGEVHDQPDQQRQVADEVQRLAAAGRLAAVVLEMAEVPHSTAALPRDATAAQVQQALQWRGWPWERYEAVAMNAVRAGVPVLGGNLPREQLRAAMADASLDDKLSAAARARLAQAVREGHCKLLPQAQLPGMVRVQIARDLSLAATAAQALRSAQPDQTVLLLAGAQHASRDRGIPLHLARTHPSLPLHVVMFGALSGNLAADERRDAELTPQPDRCEDLRRGLGASAPT